MATDTATPPSNWRQILSWLFRRTLLVLFLTVILAGLYLRMVGLPRWATDQILAKASAGAYLVDLESVRWSVSRGIILKKVALYRKGVVGGAAIQAGEIRVKFDYTELAKGQFVVTDVTIRDSVVSPLMVSEGHTSTTSTGMRDISLTCRLIMDRSEFLGVRIDRLVADVECKDKTIKVSNVSGDVTGPNTTLPGRLLTGRATYDDKSHILAGELTAELDPNILAPLYQTLNMNGMYHFVQRFSIQKTSPTFTLQFEKLCHKGGALTIKGRVGLQDAAYRDVPISRADATLDMLFSSTNSHLIVDPIYALRPEGHAQGRIAIDYKNPSIEFNGVSHFDPKRLIHMLGLFPDSTLAGVTFSGPVNMYATGRIDRTQSDLSDIYMEATAEEVHYKRVVVDECSFKLHHFGRTNDFSNIVCSAYSGTLNASARIVQPVTNTEYASYAFTGAYDSVEMLEVARIRKPDETELKGKLSGNLYLEGRLGKGQTASTMGYGKARIEDGRVFMLPIFGGLSKIMTRLIPGLDFVIRQNDAKVDFAISNSRVHLREFKIEGDVLSLQCDKGSVGFDKSLDCYVRLTLMKDNSIVGKLLKGLTWPISKLLEFRVTGTIKEPRWYPTNFSTDILEKVGLKDEKK